MSLLLQILLSGLKGTTCRYIRNSCLGGLSLLTAAPMIWRILCSYPKALFDSPLTLRKPQKPALAVKLSPDATSIPGGDVQRWRMTIFNDIYRCRSPTPLLEGPQHIRMCGLYCSYVARKHGNPIVIFYGYDEMSKEKT